MVTSKRYADAIDRRMNARIAEREVAGFEPFTLTNDELELATEPLTKTPVPRPVRAWVRFGPVALKVDAEAVAWTGRAVAIKWTMPSGAEHRAWVWASAIEPAGEVVLPRFAPGMSLPFFGDLDADETQAFGNLVWTTVALEGLVNRVCRILLGTEWQEGQDVGKNITRAQVVAVARNDYAGHRADLWLSEARPKLYLRNQVLHSTLAAHMGPTTSARCPSTRCTTSAGTRKPRSRSKPTRSSPSRTWRQSKPRSRA